MKYDVRTGFCLAGAVLFAARSQAVTADGQENPYQAIVERNVFALKDPPPPPSPESLKPPPPVIKLQGIASMFGRQQVCFKAQVPAKPPKPAEEISMILAVGQREGEYEVLEIDEKAGSVKFNNHGTIDIKYLDKDGEKAPAGMVAAPLPMPGVQPVPGVPLPAAAVSPPPGGGFAGSTLKNIPTRTLRLPQTQPAGNIPTPGIPVSVPSPAAVGAAPAPGATPAPQPRALSPEEQVAIMAIERERNRNNPDFPPLPPLPGVDE